MAKAPKTETPTKTLDELKAEMERLDAEWQHLRRCYYTKGSDVTYEQALEKCKEFVKVAEQYQKLKWGRIMVRRSPMAMMR